MPKPGVEGVVIRNTFYYGNYRRMALLFILLQLLLIGLLGFIFYQAKTQPTPKYFPVTTEGIPVTYVPLDNPLQTDEFVLNWASQAVLDIYMLDFVTYRTSLQNISQYFTWKGHVDFMLALKASNNIDALKERQQVVSADITAPPTLLYKGQPSQDVPYQWNLSLPISLTYQTSLDNSTIVQTGNALMVIQRVSTLTSLTGIAISQLIFQTG